MVQVWRQQARRAGYEACWNWRGRRISLETGAPMSSTLDQVATSLSSDQELNELSTASLQRRATSK